MSGVIIKPEDIVAAGYCMQGMRRWAEAHGIDHRIDELRAGGITVDFIRALNCPIGNRVCDAAEARASLECGS